MMRRLAVLDTLHHKLTVYQERCCALERKERTGHSFRDRDLSGWVAGDLDAGFCMHLSRQQSLMTRIEGGNETEQGREKGEGRDGEVDEVQDDQQQAERSVLKAVRTTSAMMAITLMPFERDWRQGWEHSSSFGLDGVVEPPTGVSACWRETLAFLSSLLNLFHKDQLHEIQRWAAGNVRRLGTLEDLETWLARRIATATGESVGENPGDAERFICRYFRGQRRQIPDFFRLSPESRVKVLEVDDQWEGFMGVAFRKYPVFNRFPLMWKVNHALRLRALRDALSRLRVVGLFGLTAAGKTSILRALFPDADEHQLPEPGDRTEDRTIFPHIYSHRSKPHLLVMDSCGMDPFQRSDNFRLLQGIAEIIILVLTATPVHGGSKRPSERSKDLSLREEVLDL
uniref:Uncharacterized protein n=1 Tax=Chromera velia CCMP2878 TaxID=1169474 RepID=A0A0G4FG71_9ALVE|eukprot:Cvel_16853.t1-p1 / transcript=Cvel_16853.t1 / gene=Cvel_16853 / organism=Chromera_velia_CCMP2878 / gene_product=hypothetical protein / transcript_product=hypothetical protein / location=Cvel_scaffold1318:4360-5553(-) / protein_length=398 / sequence_SO=supercontig / SO=protein_coding / is_pseudo=false